MRVPKFIFPVVAIGALLAWLIIPALQQGPAVVGGPPDVSALPPFGNAGLVQVAGAAEIPEGRQVSIKGQIVADPKYTVDGTHMQVSVKSGAQDVELIVRFDADIEVTQGDFVAIEGALGGRFVGELEDGGSVDMMEVIATSIKPVAPEGVFAPASTIWSPRAEKEEVSVTIGVDRVEFARTETRLYVTAVNADEAAVVVQVSNSFIKQSGLFFEPLIELPEGYQEMPVDLAADATSTGVIVYPPLQEDTRFAFSLTVLGRAGESVFDFELEP